MYFDYAGYVRECLNIPLTSLILEIIGYIILIVIYFCKKISFSRKRLFILFIMILLLESVCRDVGQLRHGGVYLIDEQETQAVREKGTVLKIEELSVYSLPRIECDYYENLKYGDPTGYELNINDVQCTAPAKGDLKVGDYVEVEYLPKSGYILYIDKVEVK